MIKLIIAFFTALMLMASPALAVDTFSVCKNDAGAANSTVCTESNAQQGGANPVSKYIHIGADIVASIAGAAAVIMIIISGFKFASSSGSPEAIKSARSTLIAAIIGLAIVAMSWTIITFLTSKFIT